MTKLWAVLAGINDDGEKSCDGSGKQATCEGIFTTPELATEYCPERCCIMSFDLDKPWPTETGMAEECYYPHLESREQGKIRLAEQVTSRGSNAA